MNAFIFSLLLISIVFLAGCTNSSKTIDKQEIKSIVYNIESSDSIFSRNTFDSKSCKQFPLINPSPNFELSDFGLSYGDSRNSILPQYITKDSVGKPTVDGYSVNCYNGGRYVGENVNYIYCILVTECGTKIENNIVKGDELYKVKVGYQKISEVDLSGTGFAHYKNVTTTLKGCAVEYKVFSDFSSCIDARKYY